ncbi:MAG: hypothetical protein ABJA78_13715 [Ferruginibacter sp.]
MTTIKKIIRPLSAAIFIASLFSCNNDTGSTKEGPQKVEDTLKTTTAEKPAAFTPFDVMEISHTVKDYAKWRPFFDTDSVNRKANGLETIVVGRGADNANKIMIALEVKDMQKAKDFSANPKLKEVMDKAGVVSKPDVEYFHVIRYNPESKEKQWVIISHKVKDFNAWLKIFDNEGPAARASQGLYDVVLSRGVNDSNMVHIVLDIKDMAKAKASLGSEEKKKLMMSAGVEGTPKIEFYQTADK